MAWQAFIEQSERVGNVVTVLCVLTDGNEKFLQKYSVTPNAGFDGPAWLSAQVRATVATLTPAKDVKAEFAIGSEIDLTEPTVTDPVDPDPALTQFRSDYRLLASYQRLIAAGLFDAGDKTYSQLLDTVKGEFDPRFVGQV